MHTLNYIEIDASPEVILQLAAAVENWPSLLPHYRDVRLLDGPTPPLDGAIRRVKMAATRSGIPVSWTAVQTIDLPSGEIRYRHTGGVTVGMDVVWRLVPHGDHTAVTIQHTLHSPRRWLRNRFASAIVGSGFVEPIADRTLRGIKRAAEGGASSRSLV